MDEETFYLTKSTPNKCHFLSQIYNFRFDPSSGLKENIDKYIKLVEDLENCNDKLFKDQQVVALSNLLNDRYRKSEIP